MKKWPLLNKWAKACSEQGTIVCELEEGLYLTKESYERNYYTWYTTPVYHVFNGGKHEVTMNVQEAYKMWERNKNERLDR